MSGKNRIQAKREVQDEARPAIRITPKGWNHLQKNNFSEEDLLNYRGTLGELCEEYGLKRGEHYTLSRYRPRFNFNRPV